MTTMTATANTSAFQPLVPDATGTVYLKGHEDEVKTLRAKDAASKMLEEEIGVLKGGVRRVAQFAMSMVTGGVAKRVFMGDGEGGGVSVLAPDFEKEGNRLEIKPAMLKKLSALGGLEVLGIQSESDIFETVTTEGGKSVVLTGGLAAWFMSNYMDNGLIKSDHPEVSVEIREPSTIRRLAYNGIARLRAAQISGSEKAREIAGMLLEGGLRAWTVRMESK